MISKTPGLGTGEAEAKAGASKPRYRWARRSLCGGGSRGPCTLPRPPRPRHRGFRQLHAPGFSGAPRVPEERARASGARGPTGGGFGPWGWAEGSRERLVLASADAGEARSAGGARIPGTCTSERAGAGPRPAGGGRASARAPAPGRAAGAAAALWRAGSREPGRTKAVGCVSNWGKGKRKAKAAGAAGDGEGAAQPSLRRRYLGLPSWACRAEPGAPQPWLSPTWPQSTCSRTSC